MIDDDDEDKGRVIAIQSLSNTELIKLLQFEVGDDGMMEMVEAELERRKTEGSKQWRRASAQRSVPCNRGVRND